MYKIIKIIKGSKINDKDRASNVLRNYIQTNNYDELAPFLKEKKLSFRLLVLIYTNVFNKAWIVYPQPRREFNELIKIVEYNEDEVVLFLKHHCWKYRKLLLSEVKNICKEVLEDFRKK